MTTTQRIELHTFAYEASHGQSPRGRGTWLFFFDECSTAPGENGWCPGPDMSFVDAKKQAKQRAREIGARFIAVAT